MLDQAATQGTDEWLAERAGKVTASALSNVMMAKTTAGYQNYMAQIICERLTGQPVETFKSAAMEHGNETEPQARAFYELETGNDVVECGFIADPMLANTGASPDGLVGELGLVEIKCPQPAKHIKNLMGGNIDKGYMLQMQWQMQVTGREWCDFVSFNPSFPPHLQLHITRVERDAEMQGEIRTAVTSFLAAVDDKLRVLEARAA
jgi:putative phage-type endonuclease